MAPAFSASKKPAKAPTKIKSDIIEIRKNSKQIEFIHHVIIDKGEDSILADKMILYYEDNSKKDSAKLDSTKGDAKSPDQSSIKEIEAFGNVKIFSDDLIATADKGNYNPRKDLMVLENNVVVNRGLSVAQGDKFIYNLVSKQGNFVGQFASSSKKGNAKTDPDKTDNRVILIIDSKGIKENDAESSPQNKKK